MRLLALDDATVDANFKWIIDTHLQVFEQIVCGPPVSKADQPSMDEGRRPCTGLSRHGMRRLRTRP